MLIRLGYDIQFETIGEVPIVTLLEVHPSRKADLREPDEVRVEPALEMQKYQDSFGNHSCRFDRARGQDSFSQFHAHRRLRASRRDWHRRPGAGDRRNAI